MFGVSSYNFKPLTKKIVKPKESFINVYVNECHKSDVTISSTRIVRRILDAKYKKFGLNTVMANKFQHLSPKELERLLNLLRKFEDFLMEH